MLQSVGSGGLGGLGFRGFGLKVFGASECRV